jgi:hypothetical protein
MPAKKSPAKADKSLEESYRMLFREQVSPLWADDENSDYSLEQPSPFKVVPSVTTYGISEAPIVR